MRIKQTSHCKKGRNRFTRLVAVVLSSVLVLSVFAMPQEAEAATKKKSAKYSVKVTNINSNTVINKGKKLKIKYKATRKKGTQVKKAKVKFKSSNSRIATVSKKGVIKAKRYGTVKITVYCKNKPKARKTIKIRVGRRVKKIKLSGSQYLRGGKSAKITAKITASNATNKKLKWSSSDKSIAKVSSAGKVTAVGDGIATISAKAVDGSGVSGKIKIHVHNYLKDDTRWVAHRGLHTDAMENSAEAFIQAGESGFWGCECDIWETKRSETVPEDFDLVINHDSSYERVHGIDKYVWDYDALDTWMQIDEVCFLREYLEICKEYDMVPVIEFKGTSGHDFSDEGVSKVIDMVEEIGGDNWIENAIYISFRLPTLKKIHEQYNDYEVRPFTQYLISSNPEEKIETAREEGFAGVGIDCHILTPELNEKCKEADLLLGTWTYRETPTYYEMMYQHLKSGEYSTFMTTTDGKMFD